MDNNNQEFKGRDLTPEERKDLREGQALLEMTKTSGWEVIRRMLENRAYHSWVDPRGTEVKEEWIWRELNAFHSADVAKQLLVEIQSAIDKSEYLSKVASGELDQRHMKI